MKKRLLNPIKLDIDLEALQIVVIDGVSYRTFTKEYSSTDKGSCQCSKDCNCSSKRGIKTTTTVTWYRNIKFDKTDKCFYCEPYTPKEY